MDLNQIKATLSRVPSFIWSALAVFFFCLIAAIFLFRASKSNEAPAESSVQVLSNSTLIPTALPEIVVIDLSGSKTPQPTQTLELISDETSTPVPTETEAPVIDFVSPEMAAASAEEASRSDPTSETTTDDTLGEIVKLGGAEVPETVSGGDVMTDKTEIWMNPGTGWMRLVVAENGAGAAWTTQFRILQQDAGVSCYFPHPWNLNCKGTGTVVLEFQPDQIGYWDSVRDEERVWASAPACSNPQALTSWVNCPGLGFFPYGDDGTVQVSYSTGTGYPSYELGIGRPGSDFPLWAPNNAEYTLTMTVTLDDGIIDIALGDKVETGDAPAFHP